MPAAISLGSVSRPLQCLQRCLRARIRAAARSKRLNIWFTSEIEGRLFEALSEELSVSGSCMMS